MIDTVGDNCVVLFVKEPRPGGVKTRLAQHIGEEAAARLYRCFVVDTLSTIAELHEPLRIFYHPESAADAIQKWLNGEYSYVAQVGRDLGQRMKNAFVQSFEEGFEKVILVGSDIPDLPGEFLREGLDALESKDTTIGPCADGGYYLVGFSRGGFLPEAFDGVPWSCRNTLKMTLDVLKQHNRRTHLLGKWDDVDTWADVQRLLQRTENTAFDKSDTVALIRQILRKAES